MSKKRKFDAEGRQCNERQESKYTFVLSGKKPVYLLCNKAVPPNMASLLSQQRRFAKVTAVKASFIVSEEIAQSSTCFSQGAF